MTHICVSKLGIIASDNGLPPGRCQAIIRINAGILLIWSSGTKFTEMLIENHASFKKMRLKMSSAKWQPFCLGLLSDRASVRGNSYEHGQDRCATQHLHGWYATKNTRVLTSSQSVQSVYLYDMKTCFIWLWYLLGQISHITSYHLGSQTTHEVKWGPHTCWFDVNLIYKCL